MKASARTLSALRAAGETDPGLSRDVNEDRFYCDPSRGVFLVVDGVGGQAAGGKAADLALARLRDRLGRDTGAAADRLRDAITLANNDIHRAALLRPEWSGMGCVLTAAVVEDHVAVVGHVGDTRLYKLRGARIDKITRDHSPVGEREDAQELSEFDAMRHPRRNEVYRAVGAEPHQPMDREFIDVYELPFEPDAALLICSDGLTDLVDAASIQEVVRRHAGQPREVVARLVEAANAAGGKDNVTVVFVEGERFRPLAGVTASQTAATGRPAPSGRAGDTRLRDHHGVPGPTTWVQRAVQLTLVALLAAGVAAGFIRWGGVGRIQNAGFDAVTDADPRTIAVRPGESIGAALDRAEAGMEVVVEPGEYRETLNLKSHVRLRSAVPRAAIIRLPGNASESDAAVMASRVAGAAFIGFRIVGDAATPLGTGLLAKDAELSVVDVEITGAARVAIDLNPAGRVDIVGSDVRDNPGTALAIRAGAAPRITHSVFVRNGTSERIPALVVVEAGAQPELSGNVFNGISPHAFGELTEAARAALMRDNWFLEQPEPRPALAGGSRGGRAR